MNTTNTAVPYSSTSAAMAAILQVLNELLTEAAQRSSEAYDSIQYREHKSAVGAVVGLDVILDDAKALHRAVLALHLKARP